MTLYLYIKGGEVNMKIFHNWIELRWIPVLVTNLRHPINIAFIFVHMFLEQMALSDLIYWKIIEI